MVSLCQTVFPTTKSGIIASSYNNLICGKKYVYMTYSKSVSISISLPFPFIARYGKELTQWMTAAQLRLLVIFALQLITDAVEQLYIALVRILAERRDESPRHGSRSFSTNTCVGPVKCPALVLPASNLEVGWGETYEVCVSLEPLHMITSAGLVFVLRFFLCTSSPFIAFLNRLVAPPIMLPMSPRA